MSITKPNIDRQRQDRMAYEKGRTSMKADILKIIRTCLDRDPTLQKLVRQIEEME